MECIQRVLSHLYDIFKIYLKFAFLTLVIYLVAEWYVLHYGDLDALATPTTPAPDVGPEHPEESRRSTVDKIFRFIINFFLA